MRELLSKWHWGQPQEAAFACLKSEINILAHYDPKADTKVPVDALLFGLGAVLQQKNDNVWKPVAFASRMMSATECHYAQIEKETLAAT